MPHSHEQHSEEIRTRREDMLAHVQHAMRRSHARRRQRRSAGAAALAMIIVAGVAIMLFPGSRTGTSSPRIQVMASAIQGISQPIGGGLRVSHSITSCEVLDTLAEAKIPAAIVCANTCSLRLLDRPFDEPIILR